MLEKIKNAINSPYMRQFKDMRTLGLAIFGIIALMVTWSGIKAIQTNYGLQKEISRINQENEIQKLENENLKLKNQYFNTDEYLELAARQGFGLAERGEKVLIVPRYVALAHTIKPIERNKKESEGQKPRYQQNFEAWISFFLHRED